MVLLLLACRPPEADRDPVPSPTGATAETGDTAAATGETGLPPVPDEWPHANRDLRSTRATTTSALDAASIGRLGVAWTYDIDAPTLYGALAANPIVVGGRVYLQDLRSNVVALELETGAVAWEAVHDETSTGPNGVAVHEGLVLGAVSAWELAALDAADGTEVWRRDLSRTPNEGIDLQPVVHDGTLYVSTVPGRPGAWNLGGATGLVHAIDPLTGEDRWTFDTVDDPVALWGNPTVNGGGGAWYPPSFDDDGVVYWGTGNPSPFPGTAAYPNASSRPGPNLYTNALVALDTTTGALRWYDQVTPHDLFDYDFHLSPIVASAGGRDLVIGAGKQGTVIAWDRTSHQRVWETPVGVHQNDALTTLPAAPPVEVLPGVFGGAETPMAFADGVVYVPVTDLVTRYTADMIQWPGDDVEEGAGRMVAIDAASGGILWDVPFDSPDFGAATVTHDLVLTALFDGRVLALDRADGDVVWEWSAGCGINSTLAVAEVRC